MTTPAAVLDSPSATRLGRRRWKDPRLWVGVVLVAGSVLLGARLLAAADDTVGVWTLTRDVSAGAPISADALTVERVRFADPQAVSRYLLDSEQLSPGSVATRDLGDGEMLPRAGVGQTGERAVAHLPVVVGAAGAPENLRVGDVVDVWVVPPQSASGVTDPAQQVLDEVRVVASSQEAGPLGEAATRQVLLGLGSDVEARLGELLTSVATGSVVLIRAGS